MIYRPRPPTVFHIASVESLKAVATHSCFNDRKLRILSGDIVNQPHQIIVNAANELLINDGGVAKAIEAAAGGESFKKICCDALEQNGGCVESR